MTNIVCFYDRQFRSWVVFATDAEGNQLWDAQYYANKEALALDWNVWKS